MSPFCNMGPYRTRYHLLASSVMTPDSESRFLCPQLQVAILVRYQLCALRYDSNANTVGVFKAKG